MHYRHYTDWKGEWRWPNFSIRRLSCPCCGEYYHDPETLDAVQAVRDELGKALIVNSAHRCLLHNIKVGGAPRSMHKRIALDLSMIGHDRHEVLAAAKRAGFRGFGYYQTFLHVDMGPVRFWYSGKAARQLWTGSTT